jgi:outer membrane protein TolC
LAESEVILGVVRTYFGTLLARESLEVAEESLRSAESDLERARSLFEAGMTTQADVLSVEVHRAEVEQQRIRADQNTRVAQAALNDALGVPLDSAYTLTTPLHALTDQPPPVEEFLQKAAENHPSLAQAGLGRQLAQTQIELAKATLWPEVAAHGVLEADRQRFVNRGSSNWLAGVSLEWNLWDGSRSRSQIAAARAGEVRSAALERQASSAIRLGVLRAYADVRSATERTAVAERAVTAAEAGHEIIRNRYSAGLATVTELIRSDAALRDARFQHLAAQYEQRVARAALEHAAAVLSRSSPSVQ